MTSYCQQAYGGRTVTDGTVSGGSAVEEPVSMAAPWTGTGHPYKLAKTFHALSASGGASDRRSPTKKRH